MCPSQRTVILENENKLQKDRQQTLISALLVHSLLAGMSRKAPKLAGAGNVLQLTHYQVKRILEMEKGSYTVDYLFIVCKAKY